LPDVNIVKKGLKCLRCGHEWIPQKPGHRPHLCPKCRSYLWDTPRTRRIKKVKAKTIVKSQPTEKDVKRIARQLRPQTQIVGEELKETRERERRK
jgi:DNA-directed RNA polymerase subunit RPC12/RpoP